MEILWLLLIGFGASVVIDAGIIFVWIKLVGRGWKYFKDRLTKIIYMNNIIIFSAFYFKLFVTFFSGSTYGICLGCVFPLIVLVSIVKLMIFPSIEY